MNVLETAHYPLDLACLPPTWTECSIGDVLSDVQPGFACGAHNRDGIGVPHLRPMNIDRDGRLDLSVIKYVSPDNLLRIQRGEVLFNNTNSPELVGKTTSIAVDMELAFSNHMTRLRPSVEVDPKFLAHHLHFLWMAGYFRYLCVKHVNQASVSSEILAGKVPAVLPPAREQIRIRQEIEKQFTRLEAGVGALKRVRANLKRYRAAVLKAAVEGRLVPNEAELARREGRSYEPASELLKRILAERRAQWEAARFAKMHAARKPLKDDKWKTKYKDPVNSEEGGLPVLAEGWTWATVDELSILVTKGTSPAWQGFNYVKKGVAFVRSQNVRWGTMDLTEMAHIEDTFNLKHANSVISAGDVLLNLVGASVGRSAIATPEVHGANTNQAVGIIRLVPGGLAAKFLMFLFISPYGQRHISNTKADVARANFNLDDIRPMPVPMPPANEQRRIVTEVERRLSVIDELEMQVQASLKRAERLRQAILKRAFEGKLVPQDPNDEPASVLLERIRAARRT